MCMFVYRSNLGIELFPVDISPTVPVDSILVLFIGEEISSEHMRSILACVVNNRFGYFSAQATFG